MFGKMKKADTIIDFVTGKEVPDIGSEANRQAVERFLVDNKGYKKADIEVDADIEFVVAREPYKSVIDLVVSVDGIRFMAVKCPAGSLGSREREILAASRLIDRYQIPFSVVSDGGTAIVLDTVSGKKIGEGINAIPSKDEAKEILKSLKFIPVQENRIEKEKLIFRSYDSMNVNVKRNL